MDGRRRGRGSSADAQLADAHRRPGRSRRHPRHRGLHGAGAGARRAVDKRADIWAFGVVLHEMLAGRAALRRRDVTDTLGEHPQERARMAAASGENTRRSIHGLLRQCSTRMESTVAAHGQMHDLDKSRTAQRAVPGDPAAHVPASPAANAFYGPRALTLAAVAAAAIAWKTSLKPRRCRRCNRNRRARRVGWRFFAHRAPMRRGARISRRQSRGRQLWLRSFDGTPPRRAGGYRRGRGTVLVSRSAFDWFFHS